MRRSLLHAVSLRITPMLLILLFACSTEGDVPRRVAASDCEGDTCAGGGREVRRIRLSELQFNESQSSTTNSSGGNSGQLRVLTSNTNNSNNTDNNEPSANPTPQNRINPELNPPPVYIELWEPKAASEKLVQHCAACHSDWVGNKAAVISRRSSSVSRIQSSNMPRGKTLSAAERQNLIDMLNAL